MVCHSRQRELTAEQAIQQAQEDRRAGDGGCLSVQVPAVHEETGAKYTFPDSCLAPGWVKEP